MKKEVMEQWVKALRSGKYKQGKNRLKVRDSYCCLGVLCDISGLSEFVPEEGYKEEDMHFCEYLGGTHGLPEPVQEWSGVKSGLGNFEEFSENKLSTLNDQGTPFSEIADIIEANWEKL